MSRIGKSTERRLLVTRGWEQGEQRAAANGYGVSFWGEKKVLNEDTNDGCTTLNPKNTKLYTLKL